MNQEPKERMPKQWMNLRIIELESYEAIYCSIHFSVHASSRWPLSYMNGTIPFPRSHDSVSIVTSMQVTHSYSPITSFLKYCFYPSITERVSVYRTQRASQSVSQPISQPVSQSVSLSGSQSAYQPVSQSVSLSVSQAAYQSVSQSVHQSVGQSVSQPISQSVSLSVSHQPISQSVSPSDSQPASQSAYK